MDTEISWKIITLDERSFTLQWVLKQSPWDFENPLIEKEIAIKS